MGRLGGIRGRGLVDRVLRGNGGGSAGVGAAAGFYGRWGCAAGWGLRGAAGDDGVGDSGGR